MQTKLYIAHLLVEGKEVQRFVGRRNQTADELVQTVKESIALTVTEMLLDVPKEWLEKEQN